MSKPTKGELMASNMNELNTINSALHDVVEDFLDLYASEMEKSDKIKEIPKLDDRARASIHAHIRGLLAQQGINVSAMDDMNLAQKGAFFLGQGAGVIGGVVAETLSYLPFAKDFGAGFHNGYGIARSVERRLILKATSKCKVWGDEVKEKVNATLPTREKVETAIPATAPAGAVL